MKSLIVDDAQDHVFKVSREVFVSEEIFAWEMEHIFGRCWLYLGHSSEIPQVGDFVRRDVAGRPLFFVRDADSAIRVFVDSCTHRGARLCRQEKGNSKVFQCFYHAWTFDTSGALVGLPDEEGYGPFFDRSDFALHSPPRVEEYRGFVFISFDETVGSLENFLGGAREFIDLVVDQGPGKEGMRVLPGHLQYTVAANWKLQVENSMDGYHALPVHQTYFSYLGSRGGQGQMASDFGTEHTRAYAFANGHAAVESPSPMPRVAGVWHPTFGEEAKTDVESAYDELVATHGSERAERMAKNARNVFVFPNLIVLDGASLFVRAVWPTAPHRMDVREWALAPVGEQGERLRRRVETFSNFAGPGGFGTPDDVEAMESCQQGYRASRNQYSEVSRGMDRTPRVTDEAQIRGFWREWHARFEASRDRSDFDLDSVRDSQIDPGPDCD